MSLARDRSRRPALVALFAVLTAALVVIGAHGAASASAAAKHHKTRAPRVHKPTHGGLGQLRGLLPRNHLTTESAIHVNLNNETVRLPLYPGSSDGKRVWFVLLDSSDAAWRTTSA